jgi:hypothetical protein
MTSERSPPETPGPSILLRSTRARHPAPTSRRCHIPTADPQSQIGPDIPGESTWGAECPISAIIGTPNSDYSFVADDASSFVLIDTGSESLYSTLIGSSAVETSPSAFLRGVFWASDTAFWGWQFTDWMFFFENPIEMDVNSGTFRVLPSDANYPGITARGNVDGSLQNFKLMLSEPALGMFNRTAGTWSLTYQDESAEGSIQVYLEGSIHEPPN